MSNVQCSACQAPLSGQGRFCGSCGSPVSVAAAAVDPLGRTSVPRKAGPVAERRDSATLDALGIPQAAGTVKDRSVSMSREMDWLEGVVVALIALAPAVIAGVLLFVTQTGVGLSLPGWIGSSAAFTYGGSLGFDAGVNAVVGSAQGSLFVTSYSMTVAFISGLLLFVGSRRVLRRADTSSTTSCLRRVTPVTAVFILGAVILSALANGATLPVGGVDLALSPSLVRVFFLSALLAALSIGIAVASRARFANPALDRTWRSVSAPSFGLAVMVILVGGIAVLGGTIGVLVISGWDWGSLALIPICGLLFIEIALVVISLGTLSSLGVSVDAGALTLIRELSSGNVDAATAGSFDVWTLFGEVTWLGIVILAAVNTVGILAAGAMILRRRDASVARRDLGVWVASFFVLALVMVIFVGFGLDIAAEVASVLGSLSESGTLSAGISASVVLLLPAFAAAWWFLARLILPRLPANALLRLSQWARIGL